MEDITCLRCNTTNEFNLVNSGPHIKAMCDKCDRYIKFVSQSFYNNNKKLKTMAQGFWGSICVEDLFKGKILQGQNNKHYVCIEDLEANVPFTKSDKNGKHYIGVKMWLNDTIDDHGNIVSMQWQQTKDEIAQKAKGHYIGNLKPNQTQQQRPPQQAQQPAQQQGWQQPAQQQPQQGWQQPASQPTNYQQGPAPTGDGLPF